MDEVTLTVAQERAIYDAAFRDGHAQGWHAGRAALIRQQLDAQQTRAEALELRRVIGGTLADMDAARARSSRPEVSA
ncbi:hypothetical protein [Micrococcus terreus]|uniref:hypothetical protein n=1 Tax=Micrococcus terreus TaxID=574650 RepID=UPI003D75F052